MTSSASGRFVQLSEQIREGLKGINRLSVNEVRLSTAQPFSLLHYPIHPTVCFINTVYVHLLVRDTDQTFDESIVVDQWQCKHFVELCSGYSKIGEKEGF